MDAMRWRLVGFVFVALLSGGCHRHHVHVVRAPTSTEVDAAMAQYDRSRMAAVATLDQSLVWPECDGRHPKSRCGLIVYGEVTEAKLQRFARRSCNESTPEDLSTQCVRSFAFNFMEKLRRRYHRADAPGLLRLCWDEPAECEDLVLVEARWLRSNNEGAMRDARVGLSDIDTQEARQLGSWTQKPFEGASDEDRSRALQTTKRLFGESLENREGPLTAAGPMIPLCEVSTGCGDGFRCVVGIGVARLSRGGEDAPQPGPSSNTGVCLRVDADGAAVPYRRSEVVVDPSELSTRCSHGDCAAK